MEAVQITIGIGNADQHPNGLVVRPDMTVNLHTAQSGKLVHSAMNRTHFLREHA